MSKLLMSKLLPNRATTAAAASSPSRAGRTFDSLAASGSAESAPGSADDDCNAATGNAFVGIVVQGIVYREGPVAALKDHVANPFGCNMATNIMNIPVNLA